MTYSTLIFASVVLPLSILFLFFDRSSEYKNLILCITSFLFVTWGINILAGLMFISVVVDYFFALAIENMMKKDKSRAVAFFVFDIVMNAALFIWLTKNELFNEAGKLHLEKIYIPAGAAFYTLKNFSYVYDVFTGRCKAERNPFCLITYGMSYPFMLAGPVVRYGDIAPQLRKRSLSGDLISRGIKSFATGFSKTVIILPVLDKIRNSALYGNENSPLSALIGILAWFGYVWFTFTGLSDMGTGIACMNGFDVPLNYERLNSKHLLGGTVKCYNTSMVELMRDMRGDSGKVKPVILTLILSVLGAGFYGNSMTFLIIGAITGVILAVEYIIGYERIEDIPSPVKAVIGFVTVIMLFSPLAFESFGGWTEWLGSLTNFGSMLAVSDELLTLLIGNSLIIAVCLISVTPIGAVLIHGLDTLADRSPKSYTFINTMKTICIAVVFAASYILLAADKIA